MEKLTEQSTFAGMSCSLETRIKWTEESIADVAEDMRDNPDCPYMRARYHDLCRYLDQLESLRDKN